MKKGISAVLATVLIVVITVAIIGLAYAWSVDLFGTVSDSTDDQIGGQLDMMEKRIQIVTAGCENGIISFTIKSTGTEDILASELSAYVNSQQVTDVIFDNLGAGNTSLQYETSDFVSVGDEDILEVDAPAGIVEKTVMC